MKVIKPIEINDSNLTSTIPEPDASVGEVEWIEKSPGFDTSFPCFDICAVGGFLFVLSFGGVLYKMTLEGVTISFIAVGSAKSITAGPSLIYVLDGLGNVSSYNLNLAFIETDTGITSDFDAIESDRAGYLFAYKRDSFNVVVYQKLTANTWTVAGSIDINISGFGIYSIGHESNSLNIVAVGSVNTYKFSIAGEYIEDGFSLSPAIFVGGLSFFGNKAYAVENTYEVLIYEDEASVSNYLIGEKVVKSSTHRKYQAATATPDDPEVGALKEVPTWVDIGPTNKFAAFDDSVSSSSTGDTEVIIEFDAGEIFDSLVGLNITGVSNVNVMVTDSLEGVVYDKDVSMVDNSNIFDWYNYLWSDFVVSTSFAFLDLPTYKSGVVKVTFTGSDISIGVLVLGLSSYLGEANYGSSVQQLSFNRVEEDDFGNVTIIKRPSAKLVNYDVSAQKSALPYVYKTLDELDGVNAVWIGSDDEQDLTLVYGYHMDNNIGIDTPTLCKVTIQVRGLI